VDQGGAEEVLGVEIDARAVAYATRRYGRPGRIAFHRTDAARTGLDDASFDLVTSFETIEHVEDAEGLLAEFARLVTPGGRLVVSTPNDMGPTPYHVHSFTRSSFATLLARRFGTLAWWGQRAGDERIDDETPPGVYTLTEDAPAPEFFIVVATDPKPAPTSTVSIVRRGAAARSSTPAATRPSRHGPGSDAPSPPDDAGIDASSRRAASAGVPAPSAASAGSAEQV
jgi:SAM-dependent methyltransferase